MSNWIKQPTHAGFWTWRHEPSATPTAYNVLLESGKLWACDGVEFGPCDNWGGEWLLLIPVDEFEKAWHEGFLLGDLSKRSATDCWNESRAKRVMEGKA